MKNVKRIIWYNSKRKHEIYICNYCDNSVYAKINDGVEFNIKCDIRDPILRRITIPIVKKIKECLNREKR